MTSTHDCHDRIVVEFGQTKELVDSADDIDHVTDFYSRRAAREHEDAVRRIDIEVTAKIRRLHEEAVRRERRDDVVMRFHDFTIVWAGRAVALDLEDLEYGRGLRLVVDVGGDDYVLERESFTAAIRCRSQGEHEFVAGAQDRRHESCQDVGQHRPLHQHRVIQRSHGATGQHIRVAPGLVDTACERRHDRTAIDAVFPGEPVAGLEIAHGAHVDRQAEACAARDIERPGCSDRVRVLGVHGISRPEEFVEVVVVYDALRVRWEGEQGVIEYGERDRRRYTALVLLEAVSGR